MSKTFFKVHNGLQLIGLTAFPVDPQNGDICFRSDLNKYFGYNGAWTEIYLGSNAGGGIPKIGMVNSTSTTLPSGPNANVDGVAVANDDLVLFTALTTDANKVYRVSGVGSSLIWTLESMFSGSSTPTSGDTIYVKAGTEFADYQLDFDGTAWGVSNIKEIKKQAIKFAIVLG